MRNLVQLERDGEGFVASFPDVPEALTSGATREEALEMAQDALVTALDFYFEDRRTVPAPRRIPEGADSIELPAGVAAKVLQFNSEPNRS